MERNLSIWKSKGELEIGKKERERGLWWWEKGGYGRGEEDIAERERRLWVGGNECFGEECGEENELRWGRGRKIIENYRKKLIVWPICTQYVLILVWKIKRIAHLKIKMILTTNWRQRVPADCDRKHASWSCWIGECYGIVWWNQ